MCLCLHNSFFPVSFNICIQNSTQYWNPEFVHFACSLRSRKDSLESESSAAIIPHELVRTRQLESVHLKFNQESGALIPLCLR